MTDATREDARTGVPQHVLESETPVAGHNLGLNHAIQLWPTPNAGMHKQDVNDAGQYAEGILAEGHQIMLPAAVKLWPTPRSTDGEHGGRVTPRKSREGGNLIEAVSAQTFPTPSSRDWKGGASAESLAARGKSPDNTLPDAIERGTGGQLNPDWVELLMGWPRGWTALAPLDPAHFATWLDAFRTGRGSQAWQDGSWEAGVPRVAVKTPHRVLRLTAIGNGQVPAALVQAVRTLASASPTP